MATNPATMPATQIGYSPARTLHFSQAAHHPSRTLPKLNNSVSQPASDFKIQALLEGFLSGKTRRNYSTCEAIYSQGDLASAVFYIQSGKIKLKVVSMSGQEAIIAHLSNGNYFGETALAGESQHTSSASALESCTIIRIERTAMLGLMAREPEFAEHFLAHLLSSNLRMQADLVDHLFNSSEKRLARLLLLMANFGQDSNPIPVIPKISQQTLADMVGTTRSRVSFFLNRFRALGYIDYDSRGMRVNGSLLKVVIND